MEGGGGYTYRIFLKLTKNDQMDSENLWSSHKRKQDNPKKKKPPIPAEQDTFGKQLYCLAEQRCSAFSKIMIQKQFLAKLKTGYFRQFERA